METSIRFPVLLQPAEPLTIRDAPIQSTGSDSLSHLSGSDVGQMCTKRGNRIVSLVL